MKQNDPVWCEHKPTWLGRVAVSACEDCGQVEWFSDAGPIDHAEGMAYLFGSYDLVAHLDALGAPSPTVLVYAPPSLRKKKSLSVMPKNVWLRVGPDLWMSHDGETLLLSTNHRLLMENLTRGA